MESTVRCERHGRVALLELHRPQAMNAIDIPMRRELHAGLDALARDPAVGVVVLSGAGRAFCSGADLRSAANSDGGMRRTATTLLHDFQPIIETLCRMGKPVIAAVNGPAAGVGMSLALACDLMVMARSAYLMSPFVGVGLVPDGGASWFLCRRIGYARTFEVLAEGNRLDAERCVALGIANRLEDDDALRAAAMEWAGVLAARAPIALTLTKRMARLSEAVGLSEALTLEAEMQSVCANTEDAREAFAAFAEKRTPDFRGR